MTCYEERRGGRWGGGPNCSYASALHKLMSEGLHGNGRFTWNLRGTVMEVRFTYSMEFLRERKWGPTTVQERNGNSQIFSGKMAVLCLENIIIFLEKLFYCTRSAG